MTFVPGLAPKIQPKVVRTPNQRATKQMEELFDEYYGPSDWRREEMLRIERNKEALKKDRNFTNLTNS